MATATTSTLARLHALGQSVWLDFISREILRNGELRRLIDEDGLRGMTSNPTIFDKAISHGADYDNQMKQLVGRGADADAIYLGLATADIIEALDLFRPLYDESRGGDGFVSLEVAPGLAHDTQGTLAEAKALWQALDRPNTMIKIPGTPEGLPAIEEALVAGLNVNVTLLFGVSAYEDVARAYVRALRRRVDASQPVDRIASVASFFVSRIDSEVDKRIDAKLKTETDPTRRATLEGLKGKIAIANAKNAYAVFREIFEGPDFAPLKAKGAKPQRVLWASVGTKNPAYPDTLYIDELIGPDTVSTMPPATLDAFRDHGTVRPTLAENPDEARRQVEQLRQAGIDLDEVTDQLLREGVESFSKSFDGLMKGIRDKRERLAAEAR